MMQTLRNNTKWIMLATALAFVALMVFEWGMDMTGRSGSQLAGGEMGRVDGEPITYEEFNVVYRNLYDQQQQYSDAPVGNALNRQIEDAAWEQVIMQRLISQELHRRGIVVTDDEVRAAARYEPPPEFQGDPLFQTDGQFDITKYHDYLSSPAVSPLLLLQLEAYYRDAIPRTKLYYQQTAGFYVSDDRLWQLWRDTRDAVTVKYIRMDPQILIDDAAVTVSDADISEYYRENRESFLKPASAFVRYVTIDSRPDAADTAAALGRVEQIRADLASGADFAEVAAIESADSLSAANGGELTIRRGQTVPAFEEAAFSQPVGQLGDPVLSQFGYHLIRTESRDADSATVRHILVPVELTVEHEDALLDLVDSLDILTERLDMDGIGQELGLEVREAELIPGLTFLSGVGAAEDGVFWTFEEALPGEVSEVFETADAYYAVELMEREEERPLTEDEARETVRAALVSLGKLEQVKTMARDLLDRIDAGASLEGAAAGAGLEVREAGPFTRADFVPELGRMNAAIGTAFGLRPGEISGPVEANQSVFIIQTIERTDADRSEWEQQKEVQRAQITQGLLQQRWTQFLAALREDARIVDNREMILRPPPVDTAQ